MQYIARSFATSSRLTFARPLISPITSHSFHSRRPFVSNNTIMSHLKIDTVEIENPNQLNFILGHAHFIQTVDDLAEICARSSIPKFGVAFCEASGGHDPENPGRMVRFEGNDDQCIDLAKKNALQLGGAGHSFILFIDDAFPIQILNSIKQSPTVARVFCATANPTTVLLASLDEDRKGIIGVIDGQTSNAIEKESDAEKRKSFLKMIGYKR